MTTRQKYDESVMSELREKYPAAAVTLICRGRGHGIPDCLPNEIQYIVRQGGEYDRSAEIRLGRNFRQG